MELLHNLWNVLVTEDENLMRIVLLFLGILETFVTLKLFTTILDIKYTKKQLTLYFIFMFIYAIFTTYIIPNNFGIFVTILVIPITIHCIFKTSFIKSFLAEIIPISIVVLLEGIYIKLCLLLFNISIENCSNIIIYRIPFILFVYLTIYILYRIILSIKLNIDVFNSLDKYHKRLLILNLIFILISVSAQFYLLLFYNNVLPLYITLISLLSLIAYSIISIYSIMKSVKLEITQRELEQTQLHNKTLELLYNNISAFKHDFSNIITALGGLLYSKNMDGLEKYYNKILDECHINNNLSTLNPTTINNPAIYNILATKYYKADELGITINLQVFINLNDLKIDIYDFCRILGILLDNAIEAASKCNEKLINIDIHDVKPKKYQVLTIENTYLDKDIDLSNLSQKGYTSKTDDKNSHGIGLWQVSRLLKKHNNAILDTSKDSKYFRQELVIYY